MDSSNLQNDTNEKTIVVSIIAWMLIANFIFSSISQIQGTVKDLGVLKNGGSSLLFLTFLAIFAAIIVLLPIMFSIGTLFRKNWSRIGVMLFCLFNIGGTIYSIILMKAFYSIQTLWIVFYLVVLVTLSKEKYKKEFLNRS